MGVLEGRILDFGVAPLSLNSSWLDGDGDGAVEDDDGSSCVVPSPDVLLLMPQWSAESFGVDVPGMAVAPDTFACLGIGSIRSKCRVCCPIRKIIDP